jgi:hypothetical protein
MCAHFGETMAQDQPKLIQIRLSHEAPDDLLEPCGLPANANLHLMVTPVSGSRLRSTRFEPGQPGPQCPAAMSRPSRAVWLGGSLRWGRARPGCYVSISVTR